MKNIKDTAIKDFNTAKVIWKNFIELMDAVCLTAVSGYSIYEALRHTQLWYKALLFAGVVIALQAFVLLVKHFNKPGAS